MTKIFNTYNTGVSPSSIAITNSGKYGYVTNSNNYGITGSDSVTVLNLKKGIPKMTINDASFNEPYRIAIDSCDRYAYVCNSGSPSITGETGTLSIIDLKSNTVTGTIDGFDGPGGIALHKNIAYVTNYGAAGGVGSGNGNHISVVNVTTKQITSTITTDLAPASLIYNHCNHKLYVINYVTGLPNTGTLQVIDTNTNTIINTITGFFGPFDIALTNNGKHAYVTNFGSNNFAPYGTTVSVVDLKQNTIIKQIQTGIQPSGVAIDCDYAFVANYNALYAGSSFTNLTYGESTLSVICLKNGKIIRTVPIGQTGTTMSLSPCFKKLFICKYVQNTVLELRLYE